MHDGLLRLKRQNASLEQDNLELSHDNTAILARNRDLELQFERLVHEVQLWKLSGERLGKKLRISVQWRINAYRAARW